MAGTVRIERRGRDVCLLPPRRVRRRTAWSAAGPGRPGRPREDPPIARQISGGPSCLVRRPDREIDGLRPSGPLASARDARAPLRTRLLQCYGVPMTTHARHVLPVGQQQHARRGGPCTTDRNRVFVLLQMVHVRIASSGAPDAQRVGVEQCTPRTRSSNYDPARRLLACLPRGTD